MMMILEKTPLWVYGIFVALLILGWTQSRDRKVSHVRAFSLPSFMLLFSIYGVASAFGMGIGLLSWIAGMVLVMVFGIKMHFFYRALYIKEESAFAIKGSWIWLALMMCIFWLKFAVGVSMARQLDIVYETWFVLGMSFCFGLLSGIFLVRMIVLWKMQSMHKTP